MRCTTLGRLLEILMVEDHFPSARTTIAALKQGGIDHRLTWLRTSAEALEFLLRRNRFVHAPRPDLLLLAVGTASVDVRPILQMMTLDVLLSRVPVVVMTAAKQEFDGVARERLHITAHLPKPVSRAGFLKVVGDLRAHLRDDILLPAV